MLRTLKMRTLTFERATGSSYVDAAGNFIANAGGTTTFNVRGSLQPLSQKEKETIPTKAGVLVSTVYYFYTKTSDIRAISKTTADADKTVIDGESFVVWSNSPWQGIKATSHNVVVLIKEDQVALDG